MKYSNEQAALRFKQLRESLRFTQSEFAEQLNIKASTADIERGRTKLSGQVVACLLKKFNINPLWLFGESSQQTIKLLYNDTAPKVVSINSSDNENILLVNVKAAAGYPHNVQDVDWYHQLPAFDIPLPEFRNATYRGFQVEGDSMTPLLQPREWVIAKAVPNIAEVTNNSICVVVLSDSVMVKKIYRHTSQEELTLISINEEYPPFTIEIQKVQEIWEVNSKLSLGLNANPYDASLDEIKKSLYNLQEEIRSLKEEKVIS